MSLIDHFNCFQAVSERKEFSPNARSLYYAILAEFNKKRYPESLRLLNGYLQQLSGIYANSSFDSARTALINAKVIWHKKQVYKLLTGKAEGIPHTSATPYLENGGKSDGTSLVYHSTVTPAENKNKTEEPFSNSSNARTREPVEKIAAGAVDNSNALSRPSDEVLKLWEGFTGMSMPGPLQMEFVAVENLVDTPALAAAIKAAGLGNKTDSFSFNYVMTVLYRQLKKDKFAQLGLFEQCWGKNIRILREGAAENSAAAVYGGEDLPPGGD